MRSWGRWEQRVAHGVLRWKANFPQYEKTARMGKISQLWRQFPVDFWQLKGRESMEKMFLTFYQVVGSLVAKGGSWGAEMGWNLSPNVGILLKEIDPRTMELFLGGFMANEGCRIHGEGTFDILSSVGVAESKGWPMEC